VSGKEIEVVRGPLQDALRPGDANDERGGTLMQPNTSALAGCSAAATPQPVPPGTTPSGSARNSRARCSVLKPPPRAGESGLGSEKRVAHTRAVRQAVDELVQRAVAAHHDQPGVAGGRV
jgi:hypothetical protein